ncbi:hypothetical protein ACQJBY_055175 [Aegilops geniculata]
MICCSGLIDRHGAIHAGAQTANEVAFLLTLWSWRTSTSQMLACCWLLDILMPLVIISILNSCNKVERVRVLCLMAAACMHLDV